MSGKLTKGHRLTYQTMSITDNLSEQNLIFPKHTTIRTP